jgi:hypothetical protein
MGGHDSQKLRARRGSPSSSGRNRYSLWRKINYSIPAHMPDYAFSFSARGGSNIPSASAPVSFSCPNGRSLPLAPLIPPSINGGLVPFGPAIMAPSLTATDSM